MNEQEQRAIYEWLYPELKTAPWCLVSRYAGGPSTKEAHTANDDSDLLQCLPPLDMNAWHGLVEEKLKTEGIDYVTIAFAGNPSGERYECSLDRVSLGEMYDGSGATAEEACYTALLGYIHEGVR